MLRIKYIYVKIFFSIIFLLFIFSNFIYIPVSASNNVVPIPGNSGHSYTIFVNKDENKFISLYIIKNNTFETIPLNDIIDAKCRIKSNEPAMLDSVETFSIGGNVNLTLPNGTHINVLNVIFNVYPGCSVNKSKIYNISIEQNLPGTIDMVVDVLAPLPLDSYKYRFPAIFNVDSAKFIYTYVNDTYFAVDIILYNVKINDVMLYNVKKFNVTVKFLVNKKTWNAKYWNGSAWVDAGVLPIGAPDLNITALLYKLYVSYSTTADYYLTHPDQLAETTSKLKALLAKNETAKAQELLNKIISAPIPAEWKGHGFIYLNFSYALNPVEGTASSRERNYTIPEYNGLWVFPSPAYIIYRRAIIDAAVNYLTNNNITGLENIINSNNGLIVYKLKHHNAENAALPPVFKDGVLPATSSDLDIVLPASGMMGLPRDLIDNNSLIVLDILMNTSNIEIEYNVTRLSNLESPQYLSTAVDDRLASEWIITLNSTASIIRENILSNLLNSIINNYKKTWYKIINGENETTALNIFKEYVKSAVLATAYQLGGEAGKERVETLIIQGMHHASIEENQPQNPVNNMNSSIAETPTPHNKLIALAGTASLAFLAAVLYTLIRRSRTRR